VGKPEGKIPLGRPNIGWWTILKRDMMGWYGLDQSGSEKGQMEGSYEHGNEPSGSIKCLEFLE
jgi:hypothetical protein